MTFSNGYHGVKKVFTAEILSLIAVVFWIATGVAGIFSVLLGAGVFGIIAAVLMIISYIMNLVGLHQAGKDEGHFKTAFYIMIFVLIIAIVSAILKAIFGDNSIIDDIGNLVQRIANVVVIFLVVTGIQSFADKLNFEKLANRGTTIGWIIVIPYIISAIVDMVSSVTGMNVTNQTIANILVLIAGIIGVVGRIMYLVYLAQGKTMLKNN